MDMTILLILISVLIVSLVSLVGIVTLSFRKEFLSKIVLILVALGAGTLIGGAFFNLIPEAFEMGGESATHFIVIGIVLFFLIERLIHWHHHHHLVNRCKDDEKYHVKKPFAYLNLIGEAIHNFLDGTIIAASYIVSIELGIVATIAIILHEIPQELGDFGILIRGGFSVRKALSYNLLVALTAVIGALFVIFSVGLIENIEFILIAIAGGGFLYIALANLIPELHHERSTKRQLLQIVFFIVGIILLFFVSETFSDAHVHGGIDDHEHGGLSDVHMHEDGEEHGHEDDHNEGDLGEHDHEDDHSHTH